MSQGVDQTSVESLREPINHSVYNESAESMSHIPDESVHLVVTSPPYWNIKDYGNENQIGHDEALQEYLHRLKSVWEECYRVLKPGCRMVLNIGDQYHRATEDTPYHITPLNSLIVNGIIDATDKDMLFLGNIIWQKQTNTDTSGGACVMGSFGRPRNGYVNFDYEYISIFKKRGSDPEVPDEIKEKDSISTPEWKELFNGHWQFAGDRQEEHPAPFPEELPRRAIRMFSFTGDMVLDPFLGRGTTMKVADTMNRSSVGFETGFEPPTGKPWREVVMEYLGSWEDQDDRFTFHW